MKKRFTAALVATALLMSVAPIALAVADEGIAYASTQAVLIDGSSVTFQTYALKDTNGNDTNYIKIRDVADALDGTAAQFNVGWDNAVNIETGKPYNTRNGQEGTTPYTGVRAYTKSASITKINGTEVNLDAITLTDDNGGGYTYYKLRDLGDAVGFHVDWSADKGIFIETTIQTVEQADIKETPVDASHMHYNLDDAGKYSMRALTCVREYLNARTDSAKSEAIQNARVYIELTADAFKDMGEIAAANRLDDIKQEAADQELICRLMLAGNMTDYEFAKSVRDYGSLFFISYSQYLTMLSNHGIKMPAGLPSKW